MRRRGGLGVDAVQEGGGGVGGMFEVEEEELRPLLEQGAEVQVTSIFTCISTAAEQSSS